MSADSNDTDPRQLDIVDAKLEEKAATLKVSAEPDEKELESGTVEDA